MSGQQKALLVKRDDDRLELRDDHHAEHPETEKYLTIRTTHGRTITAKRGEVVVLHEGEDVIPEPKPDELATLRLQLAEKDRIIAEWQTINVGLTAELKRERERSEARRNTIKGLNERLRALGERV
jgi:hypothetical protein